MNQVFALVGLVLIFGLAFWPNLNMGVVTLAFTYFLGKFYFDLEAIEISAGFPDHLVITLLGVTYIFGIGRVTGTVDQVVSWWWQRVRSIAPIAYSADCCGGRVA